MLNRASLVLVGVIQKQDLVSFPFYRLSIPREYAANGNDWTILKRQVRVETVIRGAEARPMIDVYEVIPTGGATGDWNSTHVGSRYLFLVRKENAGYHVVRDWWRSIFQVTCGPRPRLPLDESHSLWERIALMNRWIHSSDANGEIDSFNFHHSDPGSALTSWRTAKLQRGFLRHPNPRVRVPACRDLLLTGSGQDECWDMLSESDRTHLSDGGWISFSAAEIELKRQKTRGRGSEWLWRTYPDREQRRLYTAIHDRQLRTEFCRMWQREYLDDRDNGCPADQSLPATIVTQDGDVPLIGPWPR
jgi:hypothetical protein